MKESEEKELRKIDQEIRLMLDDKNITLEEKEKLEKMSAQVSGTLLSSWLPYGTFRRLIMLMIAIIITYGVMNISENFIFLGFLLASFSPRVIGEIALLVNKITHLFK